MSAAKRSKVGKMATKPKKETGLPWHPAACAFPIIEQDLKDMTADIRVNGQRVPGKAFENRDGIIIGLDGRLREGACLKLGKTFHYELLAVKDDMEGFLVVKSLNGTRRHLRPSGRAVIAARWMPNFADAAKERQKAGKAILPEGQKGQTREVVAKLWNVSPRLVQDAATVLKKGTEALI